MNTGNIWATADSITELASNGVAAFAETKVNEAHELLKDAIQELEERTNGSSAEIVSGAEGLATREDTTNPALWK